MGDSTWPFPGISEEGPRLQVKLEPGSDSAGALGKALQDVQDIQRGYKHLEIDLSGCELKVTSGSVMAKILSSKAPLETLVISNGTLVMEVVCSLMVASAFKDVNILVPRRPVAGQHHPSSGGPKKVVAPIYAFSHVSLTNVQVICPKAADSTMGIIWVPGKLVQGKAGPLTPVFSATGCTIEGFQSALTLGALGRLPLSCEAYLRDCKLTQLLRPAGSVVEDEWKLVHVSNRTEVFIQDCTLEGAPATAKAADELTLGGLMYIGSHSLVSITGSRLICLYSPLVVYDWGRDRTGGRRSTGLVKCKLYGITFHTRSTSTKLSIAHCQLLDAPSPDGIIDPGPPSRVDLAGGLSMAEVKVESASVLPFALLKCGRLLTTDPALAKESAKLRVELSDVIVAAKGGHALEVEWLTVACSRCILSDCKDTPVMESQTVVHVRNKGTLLLDECTVSLTVGRLGVEAKASKRQDKCMALSAREGARAIIKRSTVKAAALALATADATVAVSETELEGSHYMTGKGSPSDPAMMEVHGNASILLDKCTLRARWGWVTLGSGAKAQLRSCILIRLKPLKKGHSLDDRPAVRVEVPLWELVGNCRPPNAQMITTDMFPPGAKQQLLEKPASQAARGNGDAAPPTAATPSSSSPAGPADAAIGFYRPEAKQECAACGAKREDPGITLQLCSGCHSVRYCSSECQHADWKVHKAACKAVKAARDQAVMATDAFWRQAVADFSAGLAIND